MAKCVCNLLQSLLHLDSQLEKTYPRGQIKHKRIDLHMCRSRKSRYLHEPRYCIALDKLLYRYSANTRESYMGIAEIRNPPNHYANAQTQTP